MYSSQLVLFFYQIEKWKSTFVWFWSHTAKFSSFSQKKKTLLVLVRFMLTLAAWQMNQLFARACRLVEKLTCYTIFHQLTKLAGHIFHNRMRKKHRKDPQMKSTREPFCFEATILEKVWYVPIMLPGNWHNWAILKCVFLTNGWCYIVIIYFFTFFKLFFGHSMAPKAVSMKRGSNLQS